MAIFRIKRFNSDMHTLEAALRGKGYSDREISTIVPDLLKLPRDLEDYLWEWLKTGQEIDVVKHGKSISSIMKETGVNYPSALIEFMNYGNI